MDFVWRYGAAKLLQTLKQHLHRNTLDHSAGRKHKGTGPPRAVSRYHSCSCRSPAGMAPKSAGLPWSPSCLLPKTLCWLKARDMGCDRSTLAPQVSPPSNRFPKTQIFLVTTKLLRMSSSGGRHPTVHSRIYLRSNIQCLSSLLTPHPAQALGLGGSLFGAFLPQKRRNRAGLKKLAPAKPTDIDPSPKKPGVGYDKIACG